MSDIAVPFTFINFTVAQASEVNANFQTVVSGVNARASAPAANNADYVPQWNGANSKTLKNGRAIGAASATDLLDRAAGDARYQASSANLIVWASIAPSADVQAFVSAANYAGMRTLISLVPGVNVQAYSANLTTYAGIAPSANVQSLLGAADYSAMRTQLSLAPGTNVQAYSANLTTWAGIAPSANVVTFNSAANFAAMTALLPAMVGDAGAGGTKGLVPAPAAGDAAAGKYLKADGSYAVPPGIGGGGSWIYLSTVTASGLPTADIETTFNSTYDEYVIVAVDVRPSTNNQVIRCLLKVGGTYLTTATYTYAGSILDETPANTPFGSGAGQTSIPLTIAQPNTAACATSFRMYVHKPSSTALTKAIGWEAECATDSGAIQKVTASGGNIGTAALTGVRILAASGNINGTFRLYGIKNS